MLFSVNTRGAADGFCIWVGVTPQCMTPLYLQEANNVSPTEQRRRKVCRFSRRSITTGWDLWKCYAALASVDCTVSVSPFAWDFLQLSGNQPPIIPKVVTRQILPHQPGKNTCFQTFAHKVIDLLKQRGIKSQCSWYLSLFLINLYFSFSGQSGECTVTALCSNFSTGQVSGSL